MKRKQLFSTFLVSLGVLSLNLIPSIKPAEASAIATLAEFLYQEGVFDFAFHSGPNQCRSLSRYNSAVNHINNAKTEAGAIALQNFINASSMQRNCVNSIYKGNLGALEHLLGQAIEEYRNLKNSPAPTCNTNGRPTPNGQNRGDRLVSHTEMYEGDYLLSGDGRFKLIMQGDGNLVIYKQGAPIWASNTMGVDCTPYKLAMQSDGNLVIYGKNRPIWASKTNGKGSHPFSLVMQNDGNLVIYDPSGPTWASDTVVSN